MKKLLLPLLLLAVLLLFGCGKTNDTNTPDETAAPDASVSDTNVDAGQLDFTTVDFDGNTFSTADLANAKVVLLNFWEPWCGPCVGEMADIQKLSEDYADKGLQVLGIYSTPGMEADVDAVLEKTGVKYPILHDTEDFDVFRSGYVPTTVFIDESGRVAGNQLYVGARSYADWEALVLELLG